ncbi:antibiotic biosynthesis monooxygenase [Rhodococcus spelaei]|uniref:Antibiotic biosynthesis monooxygenase n=1 Tax=Rhodococcus spelaei TaxID=2546320 RepID=A0A541BNG2_9NOCA|nr:antibiotic biosynthesis monooxygenase [Rhodococcus spelaei]TQF73863.1 antibiotic biosynthesis monooxygenase [Rhodococcus spelaei]
MTDTATAVTVFHAEPDPAEFVAWADRMGEAAGRATGFVEARVAAGEMPELDWAVSVTFDSEANLQRWLDDPDRRRLLAEGVTAGCRRASSDMILVPGHLPPGTAVFEHAVAPGRESRFVAAQARLASVIAEFPGFEGSAVLGPRGAGRWFSVLRFRTDRQLAVWMASSRRHEALPELRSELTEDFAVVASSTPFGSILRVQDGRAAVTPRWKTAMLVLLVLYPTVMTLSRFLTPHFVDWGAPLWLSTWLGQIASVALLTFTLMPAATRRFRRWLDPVDGAGARVGIAGAAAVLVLYAATLTLFGSVRWLQFWDYPR